MGKAFNRTRASILNLGARNEKTQPQGLGFRNLERETRLELATPTLARLCSTN